MNCTRVCVYAYMCLFAYRTDIRTEDKYEEEITKLAYKKRLLLNNT